MKKKKFLEEKEFNYKDSSIPYKFFNNESEFEDKKGNRQPGGISIRNIGHVCNVEKVTNSTIYVYNYLFNKTVKTKLKFEDIIFLEDK